MISLSFEIFCCISFSGAGISNWPRKYNIAAIIKTGKATFDMKRNKFLKFEMVSIGKRYGKTEFNSRNYNTDSSYVGFLFPLSGNRVIDRVAPAFVDVYNADWIIKP